MWNRSIAKLLSLVVIETDQSLPKLEQIYRYAKELEYSRFSNDLLIEMEIRLEKEKEKEKEREKEKITLYPDPNNCRESLLGYVDYAIQELLVIPCMRSREIEYARDD